MESTPLHRPPFREELGGTLRLTLPLAGGFLSHVGMGLTDTILLGGLGRDALAAGGLAVAVFSTLTMVLHGFVAGIGILVAHAQGGRKFEEIPLVLRGGFLLATLAAVPLMIILVWIEPCSSPLASRPNWPGAWPHTTLSSCSASCRRCGWRRNGHISPPCTAPGL